MNATTPAAIELDRILQAHATYAELAAAFADLRTSKGVEAALALTLASSYALDLASRLAVTNPPTFTDALRRVTAGALPLGPPDSTSAAVPAAPTEHCDLINTDECARRLDITADTLRAMAHANKVPARKVGRAYRFHWPTICEWIARKDQASNRDQAQDHTAKPRLRLESIVPSYAAPLPSARDTRRARAILERPKSNRLATERLTDEACVKATRNGLHSDGAGLVLQVRGRAKSWLLRFTMPGRAVRTERYLGLGRFPDVSLREARQKAAEARALIAQGVDPIALRREHEERQRKRNERERNTATEHAT